MTTCGARNDFHPNVYQPLMRKQDFAKFYENNVDRVYRFVFFRVGRNKELAEDLVADIFTKALSHFHAYDPAQSKSAWLYTIARNHVSNFFRDRREEVDVEDVTFSLSAKHESVHKERREAELEIEKALNGLSREDRQIVTLKHLEGYSYQEMAELLGRTPDALKVATHRAVQKMKSVLSGTT